jgi:L-aspartate oxidase
MSGYDVVVVGSGVAGLSVALGLAGSHRVAVITSGPLGSGSTRWAQGGIAAAVGPEDNPRLHAADTLAAGAGICDHESVHCLTEEAPKRLTQLVDAGAVLDHDPNGQLSLTREGGHHRRRVAHAGGDATGAEVSRALVAAARRSAITVVEHSMVLDLVRVHGRRGPRVSGIVVRPASGGASERNVIAARAVVLATGGIGGVYEASTNPSEVTGDGLALALRAGASLVDLEFVQFHPTALRTPSSNGQIPLITEALRGEGAVLRDSTGNRIMLGHHPMADLAPRDVVARRIDAVMAERLDGRQANQVVLDATHLGRDGLLSRFPTVDATCRRHGIDPATEPIPVAPAQHFLCGGVRTDRWGATDVTGLYAVGEVAATGVHGANRLASNSLLEGMVFGRRLAASLRQALDCGDLPLPPTAGSTREIVAAAPAIAASSVAGIRAAMTRYAGVRRNSAGLAAAAASLAAMIDADVTPPSYDATNRWAVATAIITAAAARAESRGCHWRDDHPTSREIWRRHVVIRSDGDGVPNVVDDARLERSA